jgi:hypothetical protein
VLGALVWLSDLRPQPDRAIDLNVSDHLAIRMGADWRLALTDHAM